MARALPAQPGREIAADVLRRVSHLAAEFRSGTPRPVRVVQHAARDGRQVALALGDGAVRMDRVEQHAHAHHRQAGGHAHRGRQRQLIAFAERDLLLQGHAAARHGDEVAAARLQFARERARVVERPATVDPVGRRDAHTQRALARPLGAHRVEHLQREAHAVVQAAAMRVAALVAQRRQEAVQQVAVGGVQLDQLEAQARRAPGGLHEGIAHRLHALRVECLGSRPAGIERQRRRGDGGQRIMARLERVATLFPGPVRRALAARVCELDAETGVAVAAKEIDHAHQRRLVLVGVQPQATVRDAAAALDMRGLDDHQPGARDGVLAQMHQVPVGGAAVDRAVLAHGRDDNAVRQFELAQPQRAQ